MSKTVWVRVDSRLVHGQVCTSWIPRLSAKRVVIVNDELAKQDFMCQIHQMAVPKGIVCDTISVEQALKEWKEDEFGSENVLILFRDLQTALRMYEGGFEHDKLQIGTLSGSKGKKVLYKTINVSPEDVDILRNMLDAGVYVFCQQLATEPETPVINYIGKL